MMYDDHMYCPTDDKHSHECWCHPLGDEDPARFCSDHNMHGETPAEAAREAEKAPPVEVPDDVKALNPFRGTDLWRLVRGLELKEQIDTHVYPAAGSMEWLLPPDVLPGVTSAWGLTVRHVEGLTVPYLAHRVEEA